LYLSSNRLFSDNSSLSLLPSALFSPPLSTSLSPELGCMFYEDNAYLQTVWPQINNFVFPFNIKLCYTNSLRNLSIQVIHKIFIFLDWFFIRKHSLGKLSGEHNMEQQQMVYPNSLEPETMLMHLTTTQQQIRNSLGTGTPLMNVGAV